MNDWSDRWDRVENNSQAIRRDRHAERSKKNCPDVTKVEPKWERQRSDVLYSLAPRCVRGASRSLRASSSDEFSWDSAPWSSLSFFAKLQPPHSLPLLFLFGITWNKKKKKKTTAACQMKFAFNCCFGVTVVRLSACRAEVTAAADSYLRGCWRATGGARLLPFSSGSISSRLGSTMWLKPPSRQREERDSFPVRAFKIRQSTTNERQHYSCLVRKSGKGNVRIKDGTSVIASLN